MLQSLLDLLKDPLQFLTEFISANGSLTYALLFLIVFVETGLVVMPLLPGDSLLFSVGLLASASGQLDVYFVIPLLILAALSGDQVNYFLGRYFSS
jgi:membrane-associated protein